MTTATTERTSLRETIEHLARLERPPCSPGERKAAEWIAERLRGAGAETRIEAEDVHGTFTSPLGGLAAIAAAGGLAVLRGGRRIGALAGAFAAAGMWEDLGGGRRRLFRRLLPRGTAHNVVAETGDRDTERTLVIHAHHDAARTSFLFDQRGVRALWKTFPRLLARLDRWPPLMGLVIGGPALVALGSLTGRRRPTLTGTVLAAGTAAVMADMQRNDVVPGANDNLTGVAALLELAPKLRDLRGLRVLLVSTGAEEANQEGMLAFARRHFPALPREQTTFLCLDTIGSPRLVLIEGEGFLRMRPYPDAAKELVAAVAREHQVELRRGLFFTFATDGLVPLREGYQVASIGSVNEFLVPDNYHSPTDTPDRVDYEAVAGAVRLAQGVAERLAGRS
jgi:peptidase M28-like protein